MLIKKGEKQDVNQARKEIHCEEAERLGLTGAGIGVAVIDTGEGGKLLGADPWRGGKKADKNPCP